MISWLTYKFSTAQINMAFADINGIWEAEAMLKDRAFAYTLLSFLQSNV